MNEREYPGFRVGGDGRIESTMPDSYGSVSSPPETGGGMAIPGDAPEEAGLPSVLDGHLPPGGGTVSSGDVSFPAVYALDASDVDAIQDSLERILQQQASNAGYLSSSALDVFDRVVSGYGYRYYCAFRYDSDSYNALMYLSDKVEVSGSYAVMEDSLSVRLYRTYSSYDRTYSYHYSVAEAGDVQISLTDGLMYYTNCEAGYPTLGGVPVPGERPDSVWPLVFIVSAAVLFLFLISRKRR